MMELESRRFVAPLLSVSFRRCPTHSKSAQ